MLLALGWSLSALIVSAILLALLFQQAAIRRVDQTLGELIDNLVAGSTVEGNQVFAPPFTDERSLRVYSGRYWEIAEPTADGKLRPFARSTSLFDSMLSPPSDLAARLKAKPGKAIAYDTHGPLNEPLRARAQQNLLPGRKAPVIFLAGEDRSSINRDVRGFAAATAVAFFLLGAGLIVAIVMQVRVGLQPLCPSERVFARRRSIALTTSSGNGAPTPVAWLMRRFCWSRPACSGLMKVVARSPNPVVTP